ncbi:MAG: response regulator [Bacteroidetes bacterium]|nr:response regulator [Bacteroidota bacterium]
MLTDKKYNVAIIDDDQLMHELLTDYLTSRFSGTVVTHYKTGEEALSENLKGQHLVLLDFHLSSNNHQGKNGLQVLKELCSTYIDLPVIVLSAQDNREIAMNIVKNGAWDYIIKNELAFDRLGIEVAKLMDRSDFESQHSDRVKFVRFSLVMATVLFFLLLSSKFM